MYKQCIIYVYRLRKVTLKLPVIYVKIPLNKVINQSIESYCKHFWTLVISNGLKCQGKEHYQVEMNQKLKTN